MRHVIIWGLLTVTLCSFCACVEKKSVIGSEPCTPSSEYVGTWELKSLKIDGQLQELSNILNCDQAVRQVVTISSNCTSCTIETDVNGVVVYRDCEAGSSEPEFGQEQGAGTITVSGNSLVVNFSLGQFGNWEVSFNRLDNGIASWTQGDELSCEGSAE